MFSVLPKMLMLEENFFFSDSKSCFSDLLFQSFSYTSLK